MIWREILEGNITTPLSRSRKRSEAGYLFCDKFRFL